MTGSDAEIVCGEWQTGDYPQSESGELYNIHLDIKQIVRHPNYSVQLETSSLLQYDVAIFKVDETSIQQVESLDLGRTKNVEVLKKIKIKTCCLI